MYPTHHHNLSFARDCTPPIVAASITIYHHLYSQIPKNYPPIISHLTATMWLKHLLKQGHQPAMGDGKHPAWVYPQYIPEGFGKDAKQ